MQELSECDHSLFQEQNSKAQMYQASLVIFCRRHQQRFLPDTIRIYLMIPDPAREGDIVRKVVFLKFSIWPTLRPPRTPSPSSVLECKSRIDAHRGFHTKLHSRACHVQRPLSDIRGPAEARGEVFGKGCATRCECLTAVFYCHRHEHLTFGADEATAKCAVFKLSST